MIDNTAKATAKSAGSMDMWTVRLTAKRAACFGDGLIGMQQHLTILLAPNKPGRQTAAQFAPRRLVANAAFKTRPDDMQFRFAHGALESEQQPVVEPGRMVQNIGIANQRVRHGTQVEQTVTLCHSICPLRRHCTNSCCHGLPLN